MTETEACESRRLKRVRLAARIMSLVPGATMILLLYAYLRIGNSSLTLLDYLVWTATYYGFPALFVGLFAWKWHRAGGILLILMAVYFFFVSRPPDNTMLGPIYGSLLATASLVGGILHLVASPWGWGKQAIATGSEVPESRTFRGMRLAARIISLLPGASLILAIGVYSIHGYFPTGEPRVLYYLTPMISGLPFLLIGLLAWNWHRVGGILLILMTPFLFGTPGVDIYDLMFGLYLAAVSLIGGILHLLVSPWGRRLRYKAQ
jgi:hypothetical protein